MRRDVVLATAVSGLVSVVALVSCSVSISPGGRTVTFTVAGASFTFSLDEVFEPFQVTGGAAPMAQAAKIPLFDQVPSDVPASAEITVDPDRIQAIPLAPGKVMPQAQTAGGTATITVYIDDAESTTPCTTGVNIGTITLTLSSNGFTVDRTGVRRIGRCARASVDRYLRPLCRNRG